mgnify:FL=1
MSTATPALPTRPASRMGWLEFAVVTMLTWGGGVAFTGVPTDHGFPETLVYWVWSFTMMPPALLELRRIGWKLM